MTRLTCPRCALNVRSADRLGEIEHCPRCLARSGGTESVTLLPSSSLAQSQSTSGLRRFVVERIRELGHIGDLVPHH